MEEHYAPIGEIAGIQFDLSAILMVLVTCLIVFVLAVLGVRNASVSNPTKMQNFLEWIIEFVQGIIGSVMDSKKGKAFVMYGITMLMFIFVGNMLGLPFALITEHHHDLHLFGMDFTDIAAAIKETGHAHVLWWKSPTADVGIAMGLATCTIFLVHFLGITKNPGPYFKHYIEPFKIFLPLNLLKEVSKFLTLGLRLYGNIFAGEVMISVIISGISWYGLPALAVWQGFSIFVGAIQAFIFTMLTMVYLSQSPETHDEHH